jgi:hypothetical protein
MSVLGKPITGPSAWRSGDLKGKEDLTHTLSDDNLRAVEMTLRKVSGKPTTSITREDFNDEGLSKFLSRVLEELRSGRGAVIVAGITRERFPVGDFEKIFWGFAQHLGKPITQSVFGELIAHVRHNPSNPNNRTYRSMREIVAHNDTTDLIGLMSVQGAKSGGMSSLTSTMAVYNEILATRPDLLPALYQGHPYYRLGQELPGQPPITPYDVPVFSEVDGDVKGYYVRHLMNLAATETGKQLPDQLNEALDLFDQIAMRPDIALWFMLEPGEISLCNNYRVLHSRTNFEDHDEIERKRHLLRIWLNMDDPGPIRPELDIYQQPESGGRGGIAKRSELMAEPAE